MYWNSEPSAPDKRQFQMAAQSRWNDVKNLLAADRPPEWEGFRFEATVVRDLPDDGFRFNVIFGDRVSNRRRGATPRPILDKIAKLQADYANFWRPLAWKRVVIEQIWHREQRRWTFEISWDY